MKKISFPEAGPGPAYATLDNWIRHEAIPFDPGRPASFSAAVDRLVSGLWSGTEVLGFGECMHGSPDMLQMRNQLFRHLVEFHGFRSIAIESSFIRGREVDAHISGNSPASSAAVLECGFSHEFGKLDANRELVEWMREYNDASSNPAKLRFYGFDSPTEMMYADSPRQLLEIALGYLESVDRDAGGEFRDRTVPYLREDAAWESQAAMMEPAKSIGLSPAALALRAGIEDLLADLQMRCPDTCTREAADRYCEAVHCAAAARQLLAYHAIMARVSRKRFIRLLGYRDAMMGNNLTWIASRERGRGRVLVFAHNSHLQRGKAEWKLGKTVNTWWPAGAHLTAVIGASYAVIGTGIVRSAAQGIGEPEPGTLEARLAAASGPARLIPTHTARGLPAAEIASLPIRTASRTNTTYFALTNQSIAGFDWLAVLDSVV